MGLLEEFMVTGVFAFMIIFVRFGTAMMIMPGIGDSFVPANIRLYIALGLSLVISPLIRPYIPVPLPGFAVMAALIAIEFITGLFIGTIARIL
ncbi:MAG: flagellar biosynthetic protein FliR, partial [Micavibrio sp.]